MKIFWDTREQNPLTFKIENGISEVIRRTCPYGDYWCAWEDKDGEMINFMPLVFDRKTMGDLFGTLTSGMERFKREISRAKKDGFKLIIIIEGCFREIELGYKYSNCKGESILKTLHTLWIKHDVPYILCNDRRDMAKTIVEMFSAIGRNFKPKNTKGVPLAKRINVETAKLLEKKYGADEEKH